MKYREFGKTGLKVSALGFGTMRLPLLEDGVTVDEKEAVRIIRHAIDSGVNYVDTAYPYHQGTSEIVVGKALGDGYRDKVFLADKSPIWKLEKEQALAAMNIPVKQRNVYWKRLQNILEHRMCGADIPQVDSIVPDLSATVWFIPG